MCFSYIIKTPTVMHYMYCMYYMRSAKSRGRVGDRTGHLKLYLKYTSHYSKDREKI